MEMYEKEQSAQNKEHVLLISVTNDGPVEAFQTDLTVQQHMVLQPL